jgi:hypothetical protein
MQFCTGDFLRRWGFGDGDMLDALLWDNVPGASDADVDIDFEHEVLCEVLKKHVVPKVENKLTLYRIGTLHNPLRASAVDGRELNKLNGGELEEIRARIRPTVVEVPDQVIIEIAREMLPFLLSRPVEPIEPPPLPASAAKE